MSSNLCKITKKTMINNFDIHLQMNKSTELILLFPKEKINKMTTQNLQKNQNPFHKFMLKPKENKQLIRKYQLKINKLYLLNLKELINLDKLKIKQIKKLIINYKIIKIKLMNLSKINCFKYKSKFIIKIIYLPDWIILFLYIFILF